MVNNTAYVKLHKTSLVTINLYSLVIIKQAEINAIHLLSIYIFL